MKDVRSLRSYLHVFCYQASTQRQSKPTLAVNSVRLCLALLGVLPNAVAETCWNQW